MQRIASISLWVLLLIAGCESGTSSGPAPINFTPAPDPSGQGFVALYSPPVDVGPYPNNIYNPVASGTGSTLNVPEKITSPLATALNTLDGFSTTATITAPFNAPLDPATLVPFNVTSPTGTETIFVLDATNGVPLIPGIHYDVQVSTSAGADGTVLELVPIVPLAPRTTYVFILVSGIQNTFGVTAGPDQVFGAVRDAHLAGLTSVPGVPELDPLFPAITPLVDTAAGVFGLPRTAVISAWSMTTQAISDVLAQIEATATARVSELAPAGITTAQVNPALPGIADVFVGFMQVPYFGDPQDTANSFWVTPAFVPPTGASPVALARVPALNIPVLATLPNAGSGQTRPVGGWPAVIYVHGVTSNRTSLFAIADTFASQGFAVVAIDLPLHGIADTANAFYQGPENPTNPFGNNERHFFLDNIDAVGQPIPDGIIDDGRQIFNIANPLNARDHIRQAVSDLIYLTRTLPTMDFDGDLEPDLEGDRIHLTGISLGSAFSSVFLGLNAEISTATLSSPFGPWGDMLTDPQSITFGAALRAGVAASGLDQGTVGFDDFVRDLQTILDPADPANYAATATELHPLHVMEILGDITVPNGPTDYMAQLWGLTDVTAASPVLIDGTGAHGIVRFTSGGHTSLLDPTADPAVTTEMQTEMVTFAVTGGTTIALTNTAVAQ